MNPAAARTTQRVIEWLHSTSPPLSARTTFIPKASFIGVPPYNFVRTASQRNPMASPRTAARRQLAAADAVVQG